MNKIIVGQLNINSIRNKFDFLAQQVKGNIDILMISETKLDESFPVGQFLIAGYSVPFRFDRNGNGGGILLYIKEDISSKLLSIYQDIEGFSVEINLRGNKKWLPNCSYNPKKVQISNYLAELSKSTDLYLTKYDQLLFLGDFNTGVEDSAIKNFSSSYNLTSMLNKPASFKNPDKPSCIDLILTNCFRNFKNSCAIEIGLSDFHKLAVSVMKTSYKKSEHKVSKRRNCDTNFKRFISSCNKILNQHAPQKKEISKG